MFGVTRGDKNSEALMDTAVARPFHVKIKLGFLTPKHPSIECIRSFSLGVKKSHPLLIFLSGVPRVSSYECLF